MSGQEQIDMRAAWAAASEQGFIAGTRDSDIEYKPDEEMHALDVAFEIGHLEGRVWQLGFDLAKGICWAGEEDEDIDEFKISELVESFKDGLTQGRAGEVFDGDNRFNKLAYSRGYIAGQTAYHVEAEQVVYDTEMGVPGDEERIGDLTRMQDWSPRIGDCLLGPLSKDQYLGIYRKGFADSYKEWDCLEGELDETLESFKPYKSAADLSTDELTMSLRGLVK